MGIWRWIMTSPRKCAAAGVAVAFLVTVLVPQLFRGLFWACDWLMDSRLADWLFEPAWLGVWPFYWIIFSAGGAVCGIAAYNDCARKGRSG